MPEKDIKYCVLPLQNVWNKAVKIYAERYSDAPQPILTCTYRSNDEQGELYKKGRTLPGKIVTNIKANGKHNVSPSKAFDVAFKKGGAVDWSGQNFKNFAAIVKEIDPSVVWGGNWAMKDLPHFEV